MHLRVDNNASRPSVTPCSIWVRFLSFLQSRGHQEGRTGLLREEAQNSPCARASLAASSKSPASPPVLGSPSPQPRNPENAKFRKLFQKNKSPTLTLLD